MGDVLRWRRSEAPRETRARSQLSSALAAIFLPNNHTTLPCFSLRHDGSIHPLHFALLYGCHDDWAMSMERFEHFSFLSTNP